MRQIGSLSAAEDATCFADYLVTQNITAHTEEENGVWIVWVRDEDQLEAARDSFAHFQQSLTDDRYMGVSQQASDIRKEERKKREQAQKHMVNVRQQWNRPLAKRAPCAFALIVLSVIVTFSSNQGMKKSGAVMRNLGFCELQPRDWNGDSFVDIKQGQIWRLATPAFLHFSIIHLVFNMLWLHQLGGPIEGRTGTRHFGMIVLAIAVFSNVLQAVITGPNFGGMSGVVYGLLGYIWMKMVFDPSAGLVIKREVLFFMLGWLLLGFTGILGQFGVHMANLAHAGGLAAGMALGYLSAITRSGGRAA